MLRTCAKVACSILAVVVSMAGGGCAAWSTYPSIEEHSPLTSAELAPFPAIMAEALWHVNVEYGSGSEDFVYNLPPGTTPLVYTKVDRQLGVGMPQRDPGVPAIHVQSARARGMDAEVDVVHPRPDGLYELVTVKLRNEPFRGWRIKGDRRWRFPVEPPPPTYVADVPPAE